MILEVPLSDMDASPTKAWLITHREDHDIETLYNLAFGKRPREELYDLDYDPDYMNNVALNPFYSKIRQILEKSLKSFKII